MPISLAKLFSVSYKDKSEKSKAWALMLEFKKVNKIYINIRVYPNFARANII